MCRTMVILNLRSYNNDLFFQKHLQSTLSSNAKMPETWKKVFFLVTIHFQQIHIVNEQIEFYYFLFFFMFSCFLLYNTCHFTTANTFCYKGSDGKSVNRDMT